MQGPEWTIGASLMQGRIGVECLNAVAWLCYATSETLGGQRTHIFLKEFLDKKCRKGSSATTGPVLTFRNLSLLIGQQVLWPLPSKMSAQIIKLEPTANLKPPKVTVRLPQLFQRQPQRQAEGVATSKENEVETWCFI